MPGHVNCRAAGPTLLPRTMDPDAKPGNAGDTHAAIDGERVPRLPHERDESSDSAVAPPRDIVRQAGEDIEKGLVDTDRGPVTDAVYRRSLKRPIGKGGSDKR